MYFDQITFFYLWFSYFILISSTDRKLSREELVKYYDELPAPSSVSSKPRKILQLKGINFHHHFNDVEQEHSTLFSKELGEFYDVLRGSQGKVLPTKQDCTAVLDLIDLLSKDYAEEINLTDALNAWVSKTFDKVSKRYTIGGHLITDGTVYFTEKNMEALIMNREDKLNGCNAELQNAIYYCRFWVQPTSSFARRRSFCPSILISINLSELSVYGAVFTESGVVLDNYRNFSLLGASSDTVIREEIAYFVAALRSGMNSLAAFYTSLSERAEEKDFKFPYVRSILSRDREKKICFTYTSRMKPYGLYRVTLDEGNSTAVLKFTKKYNISAHESCTLAPAILGYEEISGGWKAILMEFINGDILKTENIGISKLDDLEHCMEEFHKLGYVHGDLRANNILVGDNGDVTVLDFDWSGIADQPKAKAKHEPVARYPFFMNHTEIIWPKGAEDGSLILPEHDMYFVDLHKQ